jgi:hypothetical protein
MGIASLDGDITMLTHFSGGTWSAFSGSYSLDARRIVYRLQNNDTGDSWLQIMRTNGTHQRTIFHQDGVRARGSDWG